MKPKKETFCNFFLIILYLTIIEYNFRGFTAQGVKTKEEDVIYQSLKSV